MDAESHGKPAHANAPQESKFLIPLVIDAPPRSRRFNTWTWPTGFRSGATPDS